MKKLLGLGAIFAGALILTGCGGSNTYTCTAEYNEGGEKMTEEIVTRLDKDGKVESFDLVYTVSSEDTAKSIYDAYSTLGGSNVKISGKKVTISKAEELEGSQVQIVGMTKDEVKSFVLAAAPDATCK